MSIKRTRFSDPWPTAGTDLRRQSEPRTSRNWSIALTVLLGLTAVVAGYFIVKREYSPTYWTAEELGAIQTNAAPSLGPAPEGMVWVPGGTFWMGCDSDKFPDARPVHKVYVDGFWMGRTEVTNAQFRRFVDESGYVTVAEKAPDLAEIMKQIPPGTPPPAKETLVPGSLVFTAPAGNVPLNDVSNWWKWTPSANWRHPEGPGSSLQGRDDHPVVHVAYCDALAYCAWRGKKDGGVFRLPTEAEWEFASRGGLDKQPYIWGDQLQPQGKPMANTWQGEFPHKNTMEDGYRAAAPVASFPANGFGLHDMAGNVWEWCADWYQPRYPSSLGERNPQGPTSSHDPNEPGVPKRVQRGGSFLCCDNYCSRYMAGARGKGEPESTTNHIGFRCVKTVGQPN